MYRNSDRGGSAYGNRDQGSRRNEPDFRDLATTVVFTPPIPRHPTDYRERLPRIEAQRDMLQILPEIAGCFIIKLDTNKDLGAGHMWLYNVLAAEGFRGGDFDTILRTLVTAIDIEWAAKGGGHEDIVEDICTIVVNGLAAKNALKDTNFDPYLDQRALDMYSAMARDYEAVSRMTLNATRSSRDTRQPTRDNRPERREPDAFRFQDSDTARGGRVVTRADAARSQSTVPGTVIRGKAPEPAAPEEPARGAARRVELNHENIEWAPSDKQPYYPAVNWLTHATELVQEGDEVIVKIVERDENMQDYEAHRAMGAAAERGTPKVRRERSVNTLKEIADLIEPRKPELILLSPDNVPNIAFDKNTIGVIALSKVLADWTPGIQTPTVATAGGVVATYISDDVGTSTEDVYDWLGLADSYESLAARVQKLLDGKGEYKLSSTDARLLDGRLTVAFRKMLHRQFSFKPTEIDISSFSLDVSSVMMEFNNGKDSGLGVYLKAARRVQKDFIKKYTHRLDAAMRELALAEARALCKNTPISDTAAFVGTPVHYAVIGTNADELGIAMEVGQTRALIDEMHLRLLELCKLLTTAVNPVTMTTSEVTLRTIDGYVFDLSVGLLGQDFYLLTRVE